MASWPTSAATDATLSVAVNSLQTTLSAGIDNVVTSIPLTSTTGYPTTGYVTIDNEVISYTGISAGNLTGATRGADGTSSAAHLSAAAVSATIVAAHHNSLKDEVKALEVDLFNAISAITPSTAGSTATNLYNRFQHLTNQIKVGFGLTNWYDSITNALSSYLLLSGGTITGATVFNSGTLTVINGILKAGASGVTNVLLLKDSGGTTIWTFEYTDSTGGLRIFGGGSTYPFTISNPITIPKGIVGVADGSSATAGNVGERVASNASAGLTGFVTGTYQNLVSISLTAGDWDVSGIALWENNGGSYTDVRAAISLFSANTTTDHTLGDNYIYCSLPSGFNQGTGTIPVWRVSLSSTTNVYLKGMSTFSGTTPGMRGRISARRVR